MNREYDKVIIGGGLYGLYAALICADSNEKVLILEYDKQPFQRATYINQARVHMGYHYPRSYSTAIKSAHYFERFCHDYGDCIKSDFQQIYAISADFSYTNGKQFKKFCQTVGILCEEVSVKKYFNDNRVDGAFLTKEYTYDAKLLLKKLLVQIQKYKNIILLCDVRIDAIVEEGEQYRIRLSDGEDYRGRFVLNATYASTNQILTMAGFNTFDIKYELCEIILCRANKRLQHKGLTVMDGPFFSIMPFGKTGLHSLTSVTFTPHMTSFESRPTFECQSRCKEGYCSPSKLGNCNECIAKPSTAWPYMSNLAKKYLCSEIGFEYVDSLYSMKPILRASEIDDSRPTVIRVNHEKPKFVSVLSGKINTVYDLDKVLKT